MADSEAMQHNDRLSTEDALRREMIRMELQIQQEKTKQQIEITKQEIEITKQKNASFYMNIGWLGVPIIVTSILVYGAYKIQSFPVR